MTESAMSPRERRMNPNEPSKANTNAMLRIFVYGTLKRGFWNHDRFCQGVLDVQEAMVRGRLYEMPSGIPVLQVPEENILALGTADPLADVATQARLSEQLASYPVPALQSATAGDWGCVYGELLTFDDPETRLPAIDRLEGFRPGGSSLYRRVLVPVCIEYGMVLPVWAYVAGESFEHSSFRKLEGKYGTRNQGNHPPESPSPRCRGHCRYRCRLSARGRIWRR